MATEIEEADRHLFGFLYAVIADFADSPELVISRVGGASNFVADDLANSLVNYYRLARDKYPESLSLELMQLVSLIDRILTDRSRGGEKFDEAFWTNEGFQKHPDWQRIRTESRNFLMR
jgi:hypothetical protein